MSDASTSPPPQRDDFFVGYLGRLPAVGRSLVWMAAAGLVFGFAAGALALSWAQGDPGDGRIAWGGQVSLRGVLVAAPYPHIRLAPTVEQPLGATHLIVRAGKRGVADLAGRFDGQVVDAGGVWTQRGDIRMLQIGRPSIKPSEDADPIALPPTEPLGRWRLSGEICDGKCYLGAMRPGVGLAHKACANLCIQGGAPPVLVTEHPVQAGGLSTQFLLIADPDGAALPQGLYDKTALLLVMDGDLERRGDLLVFKTDLAQADRL